MRTKIEKWSDIRAGDVWMGKEVEVVATAVCFAQDDVRSPGHADSLIAAGNNWVDRKDEGSEKSGFFDLPAYDTCSHPSHNPPMHLYIPHNKGYRHVCPGCGMVTVLNGSGVRW